MAKTFFFSLPRKEEPMNVWCYSVPLNTSKLKRFWIFQELTAALCLARPSCTRTARLTWATPISTTSTFTTRSMRRRSRKAWSTSTTRSSTKTKITVRLCSLPVGIATPLSNQRQQENFSRNSFLLSLSPSASFEVSSHSVPSWLLSRSILCLSLSFWTLYADWIADTSSQVTIGCCHGC